MPELEAEPLPDRTAPPTYAASGEPLAAWRFAAEAHRGQLRKADDSPYISHPTAVARIVAAHGGDSAMVAAALLHDVLEDTEVRPEAIFAKFGEPIGELVTALTDDRSISDYARRKSDLRDRVERAGERASLIYAADKLANCCDARATYRLEGEAAGARHSAPLDLRISIWRADARMVARVRGPIPLLELLDAELDALDADRGRRSA